MRPDDLIRAFGRELTASQWESVPYARASAAAIVARLKAGWPAEKAIKTPEEVTRPKAGYKGVSFHTGRKKYIAQIKVNGKVEFLGADADAEVCAKLYDKRARELGRVTNF